jgi:TolA-binding protein
MTDQIVYKVKDAPGLVRDPYSKAIIATRDDSLLEQKKKRRIMIETIKKNKELQQQVDDMHERINKLEELIKLAIGK